MDPKRSPHPQTSKVLNSIDPTKCRCATCGIWWDRVEAQEVLLLSPMDRELGLNMSISFQRNDVCPSCLLINFRFEIARIKQNQLRSGPVHEREMVEYRFQKQWKQLINFETNWDEMNTTEEV